MFLKSYHRRVSVSRLKVHQDCWSTVGPISTRGIDTEHCSFEMNFVGYCTDQNSMRFQRNAADARDEWHNSVSTEKVTHSRMIISLCPGQRCPEVGLCNHKQQQRSNWEIKIVGLHSTERRVLRQAPESGRVTLFLHAMWRASLFIQSPKGC
jgi:hypothetical protein